MNASLDPQRAAMQSSATSGKGALSLNHPRGASFRLLGHSGFESARIAQISFLCYAASRMPYALSFAPEFFWGESLEEARPSSQPTSVYQALLSLQQETWDALAAQVFGIDGSQLDVATVMAKIAETNTCRNLDPPVAVFVDADGACSVLVYESSPRNEHRETVADPQVQA